LIPHEKSPYCYLFVVPRCPISRFNSHEGCPFSPKLQSILNRPYFPRSRHYAFSLHIELLALIIQVFSGARYEIPGICCAIRELEALCTLNSRMHLKSTVQREPQRQQRQENRRNHIEGSMQPPRFSFALPRVRYHENNSSSPSCNYLRIQFAFSPSNIPVYHHNARTPGSHSIFCASWLSVMTRKLLKGPVRKSFVESAFHV